MMDQKDRICEAAYRLFAHSGYSRVTMEEIARSCAVGKATLYKYFPSKRELLLGCVDYFTAKIGASVGAIVNDDTLTPEQKLSGFIVPVAHFVARINGAVLADIARNAPEAYEKIEKNRRRILLTNITQIITDGQERGVFRADIDAAFVAHLMIGAISHFVEPALLDEFGLPPGKILEELVSLILRGCIKR